MAHSREIEIKVENHDESEKNRDELHENHDGSEKNRDESYKNHRGITKESQMNHRGIIRTSYKVQSVTNTLNQI